MLEHDMLPPDPEARQRALAAARQLVRSLGRFSQVSLASFCRDRRDESSHVNAGSLEAEREGRRSRRKKMCSCPPFRITITKSHARFAIEAI